MQIFLKGLVVMILLTFAVGIVSSCPNCKDGFAEGTPAARVGEMYSYSTLFLLAVPFALLGTFGTVLFRIVKKRPNKFIEKY